MQKYKFDISSIEYHHNQLSINDFFFHFRRQHRRNIHHHRNIDRHKNMERCRNGRMGMAQVLAKQNAPFAVKIQLIRHFMHAVTCACAMSAR